MTLPDPDLPPNEPPLVPLDYQRPTGAERVNDVRGHSQKVYEPGVFAVGIMGALFGVATVVITVIAVVSLKADGPAVISSLVLAAVAGLLIAVWIQISAGMRGLIAGYLLGIGVSVLCPILTLSVICGGRL